MEHCCYRSAIDFFIRLFAADQSGILTPSVYAMEEGSSGQLGTGSPSDTNEPQLLGPSPTVFGGPVAAGEGDRGELGNGGLDNDKFSAVSCLPAAIKKIAASTNNSFVISESGELWVFGEGINGQVGTGEQLLELTPTKAV